MVCATYKMMRLGVLSSWCIAVLSGCSTQQIYSSNDYNDISLTPEALQNHAAAFLTPSTITGQEQDKQTLALIFAKVLREERPGVRLISLPETLSAINRAGLADEYKRMYDDYRDTGIFRRETLVRVGEVTKARFLIQLKLAGFSQGSQERFSLLGMRLFETKHANIRLFVQIWNSLDGAIAWEGVEELHYAHDTGRENPVTFREAVEETARRLIGRLP